MEIEKVAEAYREKVERPLTWSGLPLQEFYAPKEAKAREYEANVGDPGDFPYTRGIHSTMFRGRYWTKREVCGFGSPADTNERLKFLVDQGVGGLNVILDIPSHMGVDADHPRAEGEVGVTGVSLCSLPDMEALMRGIALDKVSMSLISVTVSSLVVLAQYIVVAEQQGLDQRCLSGTIQNDPIHFRYCGFAPASPLDLARKSGVDIIEYCTKRIPAWYTTTVNLYDLREQGLNAPQEIAFGFAIAMLYVEGALERGLHIDEFAPRLAFYCSSHMDFFEEIAKLRAARRLWAKLMRDRYGANDPRSEKFKFAVHTAGCSLVPQQPLNNVIRIAYEALAAVLAGVQSLHCCAYDEPIALPTEESHRIALRTQQILAYETGVANVADPLGGSFFVEDLTDRIETEAVKILAEIEERGGMMEAMRSGWVDKTMEQAALDRQREIDRGEKLIVGVNTLVEPPEETTPGGVHRVSATVGAQQAAALRELRQRRDHRLVLETIRRLRERAQQGEKENLMPSIIDCVKANATMGEIIGTVRQVYGYAYDPLEVIQSPFSSLVG